MNYNLIKIYAFGRYWLYLV